MFPCVSGWQGSVWCAGLCHVLLLPPFHYPSTCLATAQHQETRTRPVALTQEVGIVQNQDTAVFLIFIWIRGQKVVWWKIAQNIITIKMNMEYNINTLGWIYMDTSPTAFPLAGIMTFSFRSFQSNLRYLVGVFFATKTPTRFTKLFGQMAT